MHCSVHNLTYSHFCYAWHAELRERAEQASEKGQNPMMDPLATVQCRGFRLPQENSRGVCTSYKPAPEWAGWLELVAESTCTTAGFVKLTGTVC